MRELEIKRLKLKESSQRDSKEVDDRQFPIKSLFSVPISLYELATGVY